jgi:hypothetical protein
MKKPYAKPTVIVHGTVEKLTKMGLFPGGRGSCKRKRNALCGS